MPSRKSSKIRTFDKRALQRYRHTTAPVLVRTKGMGSAGTRLRAKGQRGGGMFAIVSFGAVDGV